MAKLRLILCDRQPYDGTWFIPATLEPNLGVIEVDLAAPVVQRIPATVGGVRVVGVVLDPEATCFFRFGPAATVAANVGAPSRRAVQDTSEFVGLREAALNAPGGLFVAAVSAT